MSAASSSHSGCCELRRARPPPTGSVATISRIRSTRVKRRTCDGSRRNGSVRRRSTASASSGSARSSTPVVSRNRHARMSPSVEHGEQLLGDAGVPPQRRSRSTRRSSRAAASPVERPGATRPRRVERDLERELRRADSPRGRRRRRAARSQPPAGLAVGALGSDRRLARMALVAIAAAEGSSRVVASTTSSNAAYRFSPRIPSFSPIVAKIRPTSPRGIMPRPISHLSPGDPNTPTDGHELPDARRRPAARPAMPSTSGLTKDSTSASMPIPRKKTGMNRWPTGASSRWMRSFAELRDKRQSGDERADDRCELRGVGELGERERERERERDQRAGRACVSVEKL